MSQLPPKTRELAKTTYDYIFEAGEAKGIEEGIEKGMEKGKLAIQNHAIRTGLANGLALEMIAQIANMTLEEVREQIKALGL
ncbi:MAG: hypothetical protein AAFR61_32210 [Bacteroidota bacterium]